MKRIAFILLLPVVAFAGRRASTPSRDRIVNETLDTVLSVGSDFRTQGKHPTWAEIEREAARRMRVERNEWWR